MPTPRAQTPTVSPQFVTKFVRVVDVLRARLDAGEWAPGDRFPTFSELQNEFGVTPNTVSKALSALENDGLITRSQGKGIFVAQRHAKPLQHALGVRGVDFRAFQSPYWTDLMSGIQDVTHGNELEVTLLHHSTNRGLARVDGVLSHGNDLRPGGVSALVPTVVMMHPVPGYPSVVSDEYGGTRQATEHLLALGHTKIAYLAFVNSVVVELRLAGYRAALEQARVTLDTSWVRDLASPAAQNKDIWEGGRMAMQAWLDDATDAGWAALGCTALLCQNDDVAAGSMRALAEAGLRVPQDVSVVGFDSTVQAERTSPPLTSVKVPIREVSSTAARLLLRQIHGEDIAAVSMVLPTELVVRSSTGPAKHFAEVI